jgi:hypothetical protein
MSILSLFSQVSDKGMNLFQRLLNSTIQKTFPRRKDKEMTVESILTEMKLMKEAAKISGMERYGADAYQLALASGRPGPVAEGAMENIDEFSYESRAPSELRFEHDGHLAMESGVSWDEEGHLTSHFTAEGEVCELQWRWIVAPDQGQAVGEGLEAGVDDERHSNYSRTSYVASSEAEVTTRLSSIVALRAIHGRSFTLSQDTLRSADGAVLTRDAALLPGRKYSRPDLQSSGGTEMHVKEGPGDSATQKEGTGFSLKVLYLNLEPGYLKVPCIFVGHSKSFDADSSCAFLHRSPPFISSTSLVYHSPPYICSTSLVCHSSLFISSISLVCYSPPLPPFISSLS